MLFNFGGKQLVLYHQHELYYPLNISILPLNKITFSLSKYKTTMPHNATTNLIALCIAHNGENINKIFISLHSNLDKNLSSYTLFPLVCF